MKTNVQFILTNVIVELGLRVFLNKRQVLVDVIRGAHHEGHPLMEGIRLNVQYPLGAGGGDSSSLLDEEGDGIALIQQPQL